MQADAARRLLWSPNAGVRCPKHARARPGKLGKLANWPWQSLPALPRSPAAPWQTWQTGPGRVCQPLLQTGKLAPAEPGARRSGRVCQPRPGAPRSPLANWQTGPGSQTWQTSPAEFASRFFGEPWQTGPGRVCQPRPAAPRFQPPGKLGKLAPAEFASLPAAPRSPLANWQTGPFRVCQPPPLANLANWPRQNLPAVFRRGLANWQTGPGKVCQPRPGAPQPPGKLGKLANCGLAPASPASRQRGLPGVCQLVPEFRQAGKEACGEFASPDKGKLAKGPAACPGKPGKLARWAQRTLPAGRWPPCRALLANSPAHLASLPALANSARLILPACRPCRPPPPGKLRRAHLASLPALPAQAPGSGKLRRAHLASLPALPSPSSQQTPSGPLCQFAGLASPPFPKLPAWQTPPAPHLPANSAGPVASPPLCQFASPLFPKLPAWQTLPGPLCQFASLGKLRRAHFASLPALPAQFPQTAPNLPWPPIFQAPGSGKLRRAHFANLPALPAPHFPSSRLWQTVPGPLCQFASFAGRGQSASACVSKTNEHQRARIRDHEHQTRG